MYEIIFYEDKKGYSDIVSYIKELNRKSKLDKTSRINLNKIIAYFDLLQKMGTRVGVPVTKHLEGEMEIAKRKLKDFMERNENNDNMG